MYTVSNRVCMFMFMCTCRRPIMSRRYLGCVGKMLKELRGHTSYINAIVYAPDGVCIVSGSSDGCVRVWDAKTSECTCRFHSPTPSVRAPLNA